MGHQTFHNLLASLKDRASITTTTSSPALAVLHATAHHPSSAPPSLHRLSALLAFGRSSRLSATALVHALSSRLSSTGSASVALKCLISLHHLLSHASFVLVDSLVSSLVPSSGRRSPLNFSSFRSPSSLPLSSWVRWMKTYIRLTYITSNRYARVLELLLSTHALSLNDKVSESDWLTSLLNKDLIAELDAVVSVLEEINQQPDMQMLGHNELVFEVARVVGEERVRMEQGVMVRVQEVKERVGELGFGDCMELLCLFRRLEGSCKGKWKDWDWFWEEVREVRERVGKVVEEEERGRVRRERVSESARFLSLDRVGDGGRGLRFGSSRLVKS